MYEIHLVKWERSFFVPIEPSRYIDEMQNGDCICPQRYQLRLTFAERYALDLIAKKYGMTIKQVLLMPYRLAEMEIETNQYFQASEKFAQAIKKPAGKL